MIKNYEYAGYKYTPEEDVQDDCVKIFHDVITPDGRRVTLEWSPYSQPTFDDFKLWIDLGMPGRVQHQFGSTNLTRKDLDAIVQDFEQAA